MSFWSTFGLAIEPRIDQLLSEHGADCTLEDLMNESEIIQEAKGLNRKLTDFLLNPQIQERLIKYIVSPEELLAGLAHPPDDAKYRYPYVCCEIIVSDISELLAVIASPANLDLLFSMFDQPAPLNPLVASYGCRVIWFLLGKRPEVLDYMRSKDSFLPKLVSHLASSPIADFVAKLSKQEDSASDEILEWLNEKHLIQLLVEQFSGDSDVHDNVATILVELVSNAVVAPFGATSPLSKTLLSAEICHQIVDAAISKGDSACQHSLTVITQMVLLCRHNQQQEDDAPMSDLPSIIQQLLAHADYFKGVLASSQSEPLQQTSFGTAVPPFRITRLRILELVSALVQTKFHTVYRVLNDQGVFDTLFDLFFLYEWNNMLHHMVVSSLQLVLESKYTEIKTSLFTKSKLHERLAKAALQEVNSSTGRKGYMGHITRISTVIESEAQMNKDIRTALDECPEWKEYAHGDLEESRNRERGSAVNRTDDGSSRGSSDDEEGQEGAQTQSPIQNFHDDFPEDFGVVNYDEDDIDVIFEASQYVLPTFNTDEVGFGKEFESESDEEEDDEEDEDDDDDDDEEEEDDEEEAEEEEAEDDE